MNKEERRVASNVDDTQANAFRHTFWNAAGTFTMDASRTKTFADAHKWGKFEASTDIDYFNNEAGRDIGLLYTLMVYLTKQRFLGMPPVLSQDYFDYYSTTIPLTGDHYSNIALMIEKAISQGNGAVVMWIK